MIESKYLRKMERISAPELTKGEIYYDALAQTLVFLFFTGWDIQEGIDSFKVTSRVIADHKKVKQTVVELARPSFPLALIFWLVEPARKKEQRGELLPITIIGSNKFWGHIVNATGRILPTLRVRYVNSYEEYLDSLKLQPQ